MKGQALLNAYRDRLLKIPSRIRINDISFVLMTGTTLGIDKYLYKDQEATVYYFPEFTEDKVREKIGFYAIRVTFRWINNSLKPYKVEIQT